MRLRVGAATDVGRVRALNEDAYVARAERGLLLVCDGMGGAPAGEVASQIAVDNILRQLAAVPRRRIASLKPDGSGYLLQTRHLADAVRGSNRLIYRQAQDDELQAGMGTTVVGAWITAQIASVAHVGDSRAYLWHKNGFERLTRDHSLVEAQAAAGLAVADDDQTSDDEHVLVRALGREPEVEVDVSEVPLQPGNYLVLCSDGLTRMVPEQTVARAIRQLRDPQRICDYLIAAANRSGGADNITVVVVEVTDAWWRCLLNRWRGLAEGGRDAEVNAAIQGS